MSARTSSSAAARRSSHSWFSTVTPAQKLGGRRRRFEYRTLDSLRYELCAEFQTDDAGARPAPEGAEFWRHGIGRRCFQFEIPERAR